MMIFSFLLSAPVVVTTTTHAAPGAYPQTVHIPPVSNNQQQTSSYPSYPIANPQTG